MSIVNNYAFKNLQLRLSNQNYWDLVLSSDMRGFDNTTVYCDDVISGSSLITSFDFDDLSSVTGRTIYSIDTWDGAILPKTGLTLCDIGLTGIDNRFVNNLTGETLTLSSGDPRFFITKVSGDSYMYPIYFTGDSTGNYAQFCGGFYQGFYKLENYPVKKISDNKFLECKCGNSCEDNCCGIDCGCGCTCPPPEEPNPVIEYQVLPNKFSKGWTAEFWLKRDDNCLLVQSGSTLNDIYPNNEGFFFTMGVRAENKFWDFFSGETGYTTCLNSGHTIMPPIGYTDPMSGMNPFLYYGLVACDVNNCDVCGCEACECTETGSYPFYAEKDYVSDIVDNIIGFRIKNDGSIGYRKVSFSGQCSGSTIECCRTSGGTYVTGYTIEESYSETNLIPLNQWTQVVVRYEADYPIAEEDLDCPCSNSFKQFCPRPGELSFYINGYLKYRVRGITELIPRGLDEYPEKQLGVPYSISIGGGTQGLIETKTFGGIDTKDFNLPIQNNFAGSFIGGISKFRFYSEPLDVTKLRCNFYYDKDRYGVMTHLPSDNHTPIDSTNINVHIIASYEEGSIIATFSAITDTILDTDLNLSFINKLHLNPGSQSRLNSQLTSNSGDTIGITTLKSGSQIQLIPQITIKSGDTMGLATITIDDDFSNLSGLFDINSVNYSGINIDKIKTSTNVTIKPIGPPPPPPPPVVNSIYYGKLKSTSFIPSGLTEFNKIDVNDGRNMFINLPLGVGYGYILISDNLNQPVLFRNSNEGCAGFIIPMVSLGTTNITDINGNSVIYNIYRTFVSTKASVDVWLCD